MDKDIAKKVKEQWLRYIDMLTKKIPEVTGEFKRQCTSENTIPTSMFGFAGYTDLSIYTAKSIRSKMIAEAIEKFSPSSFAPIQIDHTELEEKFPINFKETYNKPAMDPTDFDPVTIWNFLEENYGKGQADENAFGEIARSLVQSLGLNYESTKIGSVRGMTTIKKSIWIDDIDKKYENKNKLSIQCRGDVRQMLELLAKFYLWNRNVIAAQDCRELSNLFTNFNHEITSRQKLEIGEEGDFMVTYLTRLELRFMPVTAQQLQVFIGMYAPGSVLAKAA